MIGRAFSSWHELGLTLPPKTVAPQSLADILEQSRKKERQGDDQDPTRSSWKHSQQLED